MITLGSTSCSQCCEVAESEGSGCTPRHRRQFNYAIRVSKLPRSFTPLCPQASHIMIPRACAPAVARRGRGTDISQTAIWSMQRYLHRCNGRLFVTLRSCTWGTSVVMITALPFRDCVRCELPKFGKECRHLPSLNSASLILCRASESVTMSICKTIVKCFVDSVRVRFSQVYENKMHDQDIQNIGLGSA